jgi:uncharacterized protein (DUF885 family)
MGVRIVKSAAETEVELIGSELFAFWASMSLMAAAMASVMPERVGSPLQSDSELAASKARGWLARLDAVDAQVLPRPAELTRRFLRFEAGKIAEAGALHRFDLQITPYRIGLTLTEVHRHFESCVFNGTDDLDRYVTLLQQYRTFLTGTLQNLREQAAMGIVVPASALPGCVGVVKGLSASIAHYARVAPARLTRISKLESAAFLDRVEKTLAEVGTAFGALSSYIEGDYAQQAPQSVGLSHYPGGRGAYETLIRHHMTLALTAEQVHQRGIELVREIEEDMASVRGALGFKGTGREFLDRVKADSRFYCSTPEAVGELYLRLMRKGEAVMPKAFGSRTFPPFGVKRLPPESEAGMTFGFYQPPVAGGEQVGYYMYNGSNLDQRPTIGAASLIYHELVPGHHLHVSTEMGNTARPLVRRFPSITAFNEGWAEYAADLGFELGLYDDPYDRYGRHLFQVFLASRLVVDTGLNAFGWSLQQAREYLLEHTAQSPTEIESEILRYASGMPGQGLAYAPGRKHFWQARRSAEQKLGARFDLPAFHEAILDGGSLPLEDLTFSLEQWAAMRAT